mgnify:CR=1 FL=1
MISQKFRIGIDVGSVSVNLVVLDGGGGVVDESYLRHKGRPMRVAAEALQDALGRYGEESIVGAAATGTGGRVVAEVLGCVFVNEVVAQAAATSAIVDAARAADLVIMAASDNAFPADNYRHADSAGVVLRSGRPLLILGRTLEEIHFKKILIAWKDTREARRAIADAIPLLREANQVIVVAATSDIQQELHESTNDIKDFLAGHGVIARTEFITTDDEVASLLRFIDESRADLVVAGAYGHSRLREWAFGGITRSLLKRQELNLLISS